jgi:hypothetical protein
MRTVGLLLVVAALAWGAGAARAERPATADEKAAILDGLGAKSEPSCYVAEVSTVDDAWATLAFAGPMQGETVNQFVARCDPGNGTDVAHNAGAGWKHVTAGSDFGLCPIPHVPTAVALDFNLCTKPGRTTIPRGARLVTRPRTLGPYARLHWSHWGAKVAIARGILAADGTAIRLRAWNLRPCGRHPTYLRMRMTPVHAADRARLRPLTKVVEEACP